MVAAACGNLEILRLFDLTKRNVFRAPDGKVLTSLQCAIRNGHIEIAKILYGIQNDYNDIFDNYDDGWDHFAILVIAAADNKEDIVSFLLARGLSINKRTFFGNKTALGNACKNGHKEMVAFLLDQNANPNRKFGLDKKKSALRVACRIGDIEMVKMLLDKGACLDLDKWPALMVAIARGNLEIVKLLIQHGANIHKLVNDYKTPLIEAAIAGHIKIAEYLLSLGVDVNAIDSNGYTASDHAVEDNNLEMLELLKKNGGIRKKK